MKTKSSCALARDGLRVEFHTHTCTVYSRRIFFDLNLYVDFKAQLISDKRKTILQLRHHAWHNLNQVNKEARISRLNLIRSYVEKCDLFQAKCISEHNHYQLDSVQ